MELGPANGTMTELLIQDFKEIDLVEGSETQCDILREKFPSVRVTHSLFEDYEPERKYDIILLGHILEHVDNPVQILNRIKKWLKHNGKVFCAVPNSHSLHRQAGVVMGLLDFEGQLNDTDIKHGHRRVYHAETLRSDFVQAGYRVEHMGGYWLKTQSNKQIEQMGNPQMLEAYMSIGERYPDIAAELYIVASSGMIIDKVRENP